MKVLLFVFFFSCSGYAEVIPADPVSSLTAANEDALAALAILLARCSKIGFIDYSIKEGCRSHAKMGQFNIATAKFCAESNDLELIPCLSAADSNVFHESVLKVCREIIGFSSGGAGRGSCLSYFSKTHSSYDVGATQQCFKMAKGNFFRSTSCLNAIRDRAVDNDKILSDCGTQVKLDRLATTYAECVESVVVGNGKIGGTSCNSTESLPKNSRSIERSGQR